MLNISSEGLLVGACNPVLRRQPVGFEHANLTDLLNGALRDASSKANP